MTSLFRTFKQWKHLLWYGLAVLITQPLFSVGHYWWNFNQNAYTPEDDSIAIPIVSEFLLLIVVAPIILYLIFKLRARYPGRISLWVMPRLRSAYIITLIFAVMIAAGLGSVYEVIAYKNVPLAVNVALWLWLMLNLRAEYVQSLP